MELSPFVAIPKGITAWAMRSASGAERKVEAVWRHVNATRFGHLSTTECSTEISALDTPNAETAKSWRPLLSADTGRTDDTHPIPAKNSVRSMLNGAISRMRPDGRTRNAGGVERDALAFAGSGDNIVVFDASEKGVLLAWTRSGIHAEIHRMRFKDLSWLGEFDCSWRTI
jgi:hypothetical protein